MLYRDFGLVGAMGARWNELDGTTVVGEKLFKLCRCFIIQAPESRRAPDGFVESQHSSVGLDVGGRRPRGHGFKMDIPVPDRDEDVLVAFPGFDRKATGGINMRNVGKF
jgi:hypothetical protein